jgi:hypothetical protein
MLASLLILGFSAILLAYWFRYSCVLLLRNAAELTRPVNEEADARFSFTQVREKLETAPELDPLHRSLQRDFQVVKYLVEHAAGIELASIEERLLVLDYRVMQCYYRLTKALFPRQARQALGEMAGVLGALVQRIDAQA